VADPDAHIPLGTLADFEGQPKTVLRDYDSLVIPAMTVTLEGLAALLDLLDKGVDEIEAYRAQRAEDEQFAAEAAELDDLEPL
jgi:hypothetical protein